MGPVLVLNASYQAIGAVSWQRAVCLILAGKADLVERRASMIRSSGGFEMEAPSVIRLVKMVTQVFNHRELPLTRRGLNARDRGECQVKGCERRGDSIDHLLPKSRGGLHTWTNTVLMCKTHNQLKDNRTIAETGWRLKARPVSPKFEVLLSHTKDPSWEYWLSLAS